MNLDTTLKRIRGQSPVGLFRKAWKKGVRSTKLRLDERSARNAAQQISDRELLSSIKSEYRSLEEVLTAIDERHPNVMGIEYDDTFFRKFVEFYPEETQKRILAANRICEHEFAYGGPDYVSISGEMDWHRDYRSGCRWNKNTYYERITMNPPVEGADILFPWWLSSFYFALPLVQAWKLSRFVEGESIGDDERYAKEFRALFEHWIDENPYPFGINWNSTAIVSIRLVHLLWAWELFRGCDLFDSKFRVEWLKQILRHARHVKRNLEWFPVRTNHYLTNLAALQYVGFVVPEFADSQEWVDFAHKELEREIEHHVYSDGSVHEGSLNYHRFAIEIFVSCVVQANARGKAYSDAFLERLEKSIEFLAMIRRPDGTVPQVGDAADIRLQDLDTRNILKDPTHVLATGAISFRNASLQSGYREFPAYSYWLSGERGRKAFYSLNPDSKSISKSFPDGGYHIVRQGRIWILMRCGALGLRGVSGHGHYDQLSIEVFVDGCPLIIDPGWYKYEADPDRYAWFKSTKAHNTVTVDGRNQLAFESFSYPPPKRPVPRITKWEVESEMMIVRGKHELYSDLPNPVTHERTLRIVGDSEIEILDEVMGEGDHELELSYTFSPSVKLNRAENGYEMEASGLKGVFEQEFDRGVRTRVADTEVALCYGSLAHGKRLASKWSGSMPAVGLTKMKFD